MMTVVQSASGIRTSILGLKVDRATSSLPATTDLTIFNVTGGRVIVTSILGEVTTVIQAQACAIKLKSVPTTGTAVDLSYYLIGDRQTMQAATSTDYKFANDKVAFRITERVDGRAWLRSAITPKNGGNTLSAFVNLSSTRT